MAKFSDNLPTIEETAAFSTVIDIINQFLDGSFKKLVAFPDGRIGYVCSVITGAASNSNLKFRESIIIASPNNSDIESPEMTLNVYPDRLDFPFTHFPHINPKEDGFPRSICLVRENFNDWYAEHTFQDFLCLITQWFADAKDGNLVKTKEGDRWEPFYLGEPDLHYFRYPIFDNTLQTYDDPYQLVFEIDAKTLEGPRDYKYDPDNGFLGLLLYRGAMHPLKTWIYDTPRTIGQLLNLIETYEVWNKGSLIGKVIECRDKYKFIFLQIGFCRPVNIIGKTNKVDYICFKASVDAIAERKFDEDIQLVQIIDLPTPQFARGLSNTSEDIGSKDIAIIGCGAIGSKLAYHLFRTGFEKLTLIDSDYMLPHNYLRHGLSMGRFLDNKAKLLKEFLKIMLPRFGSNVKSIEDDVISKITSNHLHNDIIIDCTASAMVLHAIDEHRPNLSQSIVRFAISDGGKVGLVYFNSTKGVRLSDYYMYLLRLCVTNLEYEEDFSQWFKTESSYTLDKIRIGEGCHSNTMVLGDDLISTHTGIASNLIRNYKYCNRENEIYLSFLDYDWPGSCHTDKVSVPDFEQYNLESSEWKVRVPKDLEDFISAQSRHAGKNETGGYLMGCWDIKRKVVYILHTFIPTDIRGTHSKLTLGTGGWKKEIDRVQKLTSGTLRYIGDWHSHPKGSTRMSNIDVKSCAATLCTEMENNRFICLICNGEQLSFNLLSLTDQRIIAPK